MRIQVLGRRTDAFDAGEDLEELFLLALEPVDFSVEVLLVCVGRQIVEVGELKARHYRNLSA